MSTKIYNAYKFNGKPHELMEHLRLYRPKWHEFQIERICGLLSEAPPFNVLQEKIAEQSAKSYPSWNDEYDVRGSVAVYFHKRNIYVQTFLQTSGKPPEFKDERFIDFHYQNQVDPWYDYDETLSAADKKKAARNWNTRKKVWDEIFSGRFDSASEAGMIYEMCQTTDFYEIARRITEKFR
jgi:hypothetical protein